MEVVRAVVQITDGQHALDFLVVYGSVARGDHNEASDLDIYFKAHDLLGPYDKPHDQWQVLGLPAGALLEALREGQDFAFNVVRDGLNVVDSGRYRDALTAVDQEGLVPKPDDHDSGAS